MITVCGGVFSSVYITFTKSVNNLLYRENKKYEFDIDALIQSALLDNLENLNIEHLMEK